MRFVNKTESADADAKPAVEPERIPHVASQNYKKHQGEIKKIAVDILQDQRKGSFAQVCLPRLANGARRRIGPKSLVISPSIVVARHAKSPGRPENQHRSCDPDRHPAWVWSKPTLVGGAEQFGRIKR